jgi:hypothetical protein
VAAGECGIGPRARSGRRPHPRRLLIYTKAVMNRLARAMASRGWAAWNIEYRRTGPLGGGGGRPATLADAAGVVANQLAVCGPKV